MKKIRFFKKAISAISITCLLVMIAGIEKSPLFGLLIIPFAVLMYASGGCYRCFYRRKKSKPRLKTKSQMCVCVKPQPIRGLPYYCLITDRFHDEWIKHEYILWEPWNSMVP